MTLNDLMIMISEFAWLWKEAVVAYLQILDYLETLKVGHTSSAETLVSDQKMTPGKNPKSFIQQENRGGSLQSHIVWNLRKLGMLL
jgi:hypothetical protein